MNECIICRKTESELLCENELAKAFFDSFPVNRGHVLIVTKRHVAAYFEASQDEVIAINDLLLKVKKLLDEKYKPDGYNIGINVGGAAGQTIFHIHAHVIPRYVGDVKNPRGGVRKIKKSIVPYPEEENLAGKVYNKLVRDKIPELIREAGKESIIRIADIEQYRRLLQLKLWEEVEEFIATGNKEELADILEVVKSLAMEHGMSWDELVALTDKKALQSGRFEDRIVLERVLEDPGD